MIDREREMNDNDFWALINAGIVGAVIHPRGGLVILIMWGVCRLNGWGIFAFANY
jgi:hypothetical protein